MIKVKIEENITSEKIIDLMLKDLKINNYTIKKNKYGYPYLSNINNLYFNISNKDNITICAISDKIIGVDIEKPIYKEKLLDRFFTNEEKEYLLNSKNKEEAFAIMWTKKESYVKMLGIGLSYGLKNVDTLNLQNIFTIKKYKKYICCICQKKKA